MRWDNFIYPLNFLDTVLQWCSKSVPWKVLLVHQNNVSHVLGVLFKQYVFLSNNRGTKYKQNNHFFVKKNIIKYLYTVYVCGNKYFNPGGCNPIFFHCPYTLVVRSGRVSWFKPIWWYWISVSRKYTTLPYFTIWHAQTVCVNDLTCLEHTEQSLQ